MLQSGGFTRFGHRALTERSQRRHHLQLLFETGVFMFMEALVQIDARDGSMRRTKYQLPLHIVSAVASEAGDEIALLAAPGRQRSSSPSLWLYRITPVEPVWQRAAAS